MSSLVFFGRIQVRLIILILLISAAFIVALVIQNKNESDTIEQSITGLKTERTLWLDEVLNISSEKIESYAFDNTFWDELVDFLSHRNIGWAQENFTPSLKKLNIHYLWIYDHSFNCIYSSDKNKNRIAKLGLLDSTTFRNLLKRKYFNHFFIDHNNDILEIFTAPIQPSSDFERISIPKGYFIVAKIWDHKLLNKLSLLTTSEATIQDSTITDLSGTKEGNTMILEKNMLDYQDKIIKKINFRFSPQILELSVAAANRQLIISIIFVFIMISSISIFLYYSFMKPINTISQSLETEDFITLNPLLRSRTEFNHLAILIIEYFKQKSTLLSEISQRNKTETELRLSEAKYRSLFENMANGLSLNEIILDDCGIPVDYRILQMNSAMEKQIGVETKQFIGKKISEIRDDNHAEYIKSYGEVALSGNPKTFETYDKDLKKMLQITAFSPKIGLFALIIIDITDRKKSELDLKESNLRLETALNELKQTQKQLLQQERLKSLGQMASGIAHDINNSLSPILGYADLLLNNKKNSDISKQLGMIKTASLDIKRTIEHLREFYRPRLDDEFSEYIQINKVVKSAIELTKHRWKTIPESEGKTIVIKTDLNRNLPFIKGNESELRESIINLIINSSDAVNNNGVLNFKTSSSNHKVVLELRDNGSGMDEETKAHCLEPFYSTKGNKGTGLGLSMVFGIVQRHNGEIQIESEYRKGTSIRLIFPAEISEMEEISSDNLAAIPPLNILCIDDDQSVLEIIKNLLTENNHNVTIISSGQEGILLFVEAINSNKPFDIVLTDLGMPNMDGKEVARHLKTINPTTPIILLTGWGTFLEQDEIKEVDFILSKPITLSDINQAFNNIYKI